MDTHSHRSNTSRVRDKERERDKPRLAKASKESLVLLALEKEENKKLNVLLEEYRKSNQELLRRTEQAEVDIVTATSRVVKVHNARLKLNEEIDSTNALLQQYRLQLETARSEIRKADEAIQKLNQLRSHERERAEKWKAKYLSLHATISREKAFQEGRREGVLEGRRHAELQPGYSSESGSRVSTIEYDSRRTSFTRDSSRGEDDYSDTNEAPVLPSQPTPPPPPPPQPDPVIPPPPIIRDPTPPPVRYQPPPPRARSPTPPRAPSPTPVSSPPLPVPMRNLNSNEQIRPIITQHHPNFQSPPPPQPGIIPPDTFIPHLDPGTQEIPMPHQHELSHHHFMTQMPEPVSFPEPEPAPYPEPEPIIVPPPGSYRNTMVNMMSDAQYRAAQSSPESASTTLSLTQMEIVNSNPNLRRINSPMSTIMEAPSGQATPNVIEEQVLPRKPSIHSISSTPRSHTPSNYTPASWGRMPAPPRAEEAARAGTPSTSSNRSVSLGRKSSLKSVGSSARGHSTGRTSVPPPGEPQQPPQGIYTRPTPPPVEAQRSRPPPQGIYTRPTPPPTQDRPPPQGIYTRPTPPPLRERPPQIYGIYAPPTRMGDIREEEERRTPTMPVNRTLHPEQPRAFSPRQDTLHVDLPPPPNTAATLADDIPTPSSIGIGIDVVSPTPPESINEEPENNRTIREFLSPQDATRPLPPPDTVRHAPAPSRHSSSPSVPTIPPMNMGPPSPSHFQTMPNGAFFMPMSFTPQPTENDTPLPTSPGLGFVAQSFTPNVPPTTIPATSPRPSSPRSSARPSSPAPTAISSGSGMPGGLADINAGASATDEPPVIPSASMLRAVLNSSDSDDESGMNSEANTLTTPPSKARGLPRGGAVNRGGGANRGARGKKKKK
ncbi:hypothetical protein V5O48_002266 [Marasmius crinis-equi]|uniref:Uncharacterized protein n=1 Tax=Marasmius crinis-equi TaxID=585013 RepID=A0ABR3FW93_9AGAR